jgi:Uri superfamily endonuclease
MKGAYTLVIDIEKPIMVKIKSIGDVMFDSGIWVYVGSAMGEGSTNLENRLRRHFRSEKTVYWHIDHLLAADVQLIEAIWAESTEHSECNIAQAISAHEDYSPGPHRFGSSDCKQRCPAHIFTYMGEEPVRESLLQILRNLDLQPILTKDGQL